MTEITHTANSIRTRAEERSNKAWRLKEEIISKLGLETKPEYVSDNQPLFGRGLEMDSLDTCLLYTSPSPRDKRQPRMPSSA